VPDTGTIAIARHVIMGPAAVRRPSERLEDSCMPSTELRVATPDAGTVTGRVPVSRPTGRHPDAEAHFPQGDKPATRLRSRRTSCRR